MGEIAQDFFEGSWRVEVVNGGQTTAVVSGSGKILYNDDEKQCLAETVFTVCLPNPSACLSDPCQNDAVCTDECAGNYSCTRASVRTDLRGRCATPQRQMLVSLLHVSTAVFAPMRESDFHVPVNQAMWEMPALQLEPQASIHARRPAHSRRYGCSLRF